MNAVTSNPWVLALPADKVEAWIEKNGERACADHWTEDPYFALWLHYLDRTVRRTVLISYRDLEDWDYWSAYDAGMSPVDAAYDMLEDAGYETGEEW